MTQTQKWNVLVVDDEPPLRQVLVAMLTVHGFAVEEASSGEGAIGLLARRPVDLVLLDINMPGMGGLEACRRIRAKLPHVGIVMATVRNAEEDIIQSLQAGADDFVTKPFRFGELVARLKALLRRTAPEPTGLRTMHAGDLEIDFEKRLLRRAGQDVHLTPKEFDLLALLMKNPGSLLTHAKLLRSVWGREYGEELEYLRSYMRALRKKIEDDPAQPKYIVTEPWAGYRFHNPSEDGASEEKM